MPPAHAPSGCIPSALSCWAKLCFRLRRRSRLPRIANMTTKIVVISSIMFGALLAHAQTSDAQLARLRPLLEQRIAQHQGTVGVSIIDLANGEKLSIRGAEQFPSASVIKLPILIELFHQIQRGPLKLSDPIM